MNKIYQFKGRSVKTGEWVEGNFMQLKNDTGYKRPVYIIPFPGFIPVMSLPTDKFYEVDPDTVKLEIICEK